MSASSLMNVGARALTANYAALQTTSHNIANANTPGFSRQQTTLANADGAYTGAGFIGQGVDVVTVTRNYDQFLTAQAVQTKAASAADTTHRDQLTQLEGIFTTGETGLGYAAGQLMNSFVDVANNPADVSARQVVIGQASDLAARFTSAGNQISTLQSSLVEDVKSGVASVNGIASQIATLNGQIAQMQASGQPPNDLLDQRDKLVSDISQYIGVTTIKADDGSVGLFVGGGRSLVLGTTVNTLKAVPDAYDPAKVRLAMSEQGVDRLVPSQSVNGGSLAGQLQFQNSDLVQARNLIGQLATAISSGLNQQQSLGLDLSGAHGTALFSVGAARALPANTNTGTAQLQLSVTDPTRVTANDYELRFDGTSYNVDRLNADGSRTAVAGSPFADLSNGNNVSFDGMSLQLGSGQMQQGDRFLLQPTAAASQSMTAVLADPNGIAAASPVSATFGTANTGTATLNSLSAVSPNIDTTQLPSTLTFAAALSDGTGRVPFSVQNADGSTSTGLMTPGSAITVNGYALQIDGVPKAGDSVSVRAGMVAGNNGNALAFAKLASTAMVGASVSPNGTVVAGKTVTDAYASALADIAVRVQTARSSADTSASFASAAESARSNKSGVNLDEEASTLIQFQQSYQAAAKVLQVAQAVFDTLLQTAAR